MLNPNSFNDDLTEDKEGTGKEEAVEQPDKNPKIKPDGASGGIKDDLPADDDLKSSDSPGNDTGIAGIKDDVR